MKKNISHNSLYFVRDLYRMGVQLETIADGSRLSLDLIQTIYLNHSFTLDENQFNLLLGFYCYFLCQTQYPEQFSDRLKDYKIVFKKNHETLPATDFLNQLSQKPWLKRKRLFLKNSHGKENHLTLREQELLYYLLRGKTQLQISSALKISIRTVQYHWQHIRERFTVSTIDQLIQHWRIEPIVS
jgi:DNA-binding CsgD family transcriptional regulator